MLAPNVSKDLRIVVKAHTSNNVKGTILISVPKGWTCSKTKLEYKIAEKNRTQEFKLTLTSTANAKNGTLKLTDENNQPVKDVVYIDYDHITPQTLLPNSTAKLVLIDVKTVKTKIGYIVGAGDEIPSALGLLGYSVDLISESDLASTDLSKYQTILTGIRAYNKNKYLTQLNSKLMNYVENGGNLVVQYCTSHRLVTDQIGPYPMKLGRERVTVEEAKATLLNPKHAIFNTPNKIVPEDFNMWVQERGLYFAREWDDKYEPLISWNDPEEEPVKGGLIVTNYGKGTFIYTGISFFRELPAGVPGAYKLFTNIVEYK